jgi:hypothetical protein
MDTLCLSWISRFVRTIAGKHRPYITAVIPWIIIPQINKLILTTGDRLRDKYVSDELVVNTIDKVY